MTKLCVRVSSRLGVSIWAVPFSAALCAYGCVDATDPQLVRYNVSSEINTERVERRWLGPSMCKPHTHTFTGYRNEKIGILHSGRDWGFSLMPFDSLTRERWDFHSSTIWAKNFDGAGAGMFFSDCTHWCFSPRFWELVVHDLYITLSNSTDWLRRRHARVTQRLRSAAPPVKTLTPASLPAASYRWRRSVS